MLLLKWVYQQTQLFWREISGRPEQLARVLRIETQIKQIGFQKKLFCPTCLIVFFTPLAGLMRSHKSVCGRKWVETLESLYNWTDNRKVTTSNYWKHSALVTQFSDLINQYTEKLVDTKSWTQKLNPDFFQWSVDASGVPGGPDGV